MTGIDIGVIGEVVAYTIGFGALLLFMIGAFVIANEREYSVVFTKYIKRPDGAYEQETLYRAVMAISEYFAVRKLRKEYGKDIHVVRFIDNGEGGRA